MEQAPQQTMTIQLELGSWRVIADGEDLGVFEGSWSGPVSVSVQLERVA